MCFLQNIIFAIEQEDVR